MKLFLLAVLCTTAVAYSGYGNAVYEVYSDDYYSSEEHHEEKPKCAKLDHFKVIPPSAMLYSREAKYSHFIRDGDSYVKISCPNDGVEYYLLAFNRDNSSGEPNFSSIANSMYLASGFKVELVARCDDDKIMVKTATNEVRIEKVTCISYLSFGNRGNMNL